MRTTATTAILGALTLLLALGVASGCGGGGDGGSGPPATRTQRLSAVPDLDGTVTSDGTASSDHSVFGPVVGDGDLAVPGRVMAAYYTFDLGSIPTGAQVLDAELRLHQISVMGTPYATHGHLQAQSVDYGTTLDPGDWSPPTYGTADLGPATPAVEDKTADVTALLQAAVAAGRPRFQVRVAFSDLGSDLDGQSDTVFLIDAGDAHGTGFPPALDVLHTAP